MNDNSTTAGFDYCVKCGVKLTSTRHYIDNEGPFCTKHAEDVAQEKMPGERYSCIFEYKAPTERPRWLEAEKHDPYWQEKYRQVQRNEDRSDYFANFAAEQRVEKLEGAMADFALKIRELEKEIADKEVEDYNQREDMLEIVKMPGSSFGGVLKWSLIEREARSLRDTCHTSITRLYNMVKVYEKIMEAIDITDVLDANDVTKMHALMLGAKADLEHFSNMSMGEIDRKTTKTSFDIFFDKEYENPEFKKEYDKTRKEIDERQNNK